jgi:hypothetical protein
MEGQTDINPGTSLVFGMMLEYDSFWLPEV